MGLLSPARISQLDYCLRYFNMTWRQGEGESNSNNHMEGDLMMQRAVMFTAVLMAILGGTLCVVGLERLIRGRSTLFSMVRFLLRFTFVLFLPLLSYMASHAERKEGQLQFVLLWLLLIELVRKKVEVMVRSADGSFSRAADRFRPMGHSDEVTRLVWIGYLIYSSIIGHGSTLVMTIFSILWLLALAKLGQRVLNEWRAQESLAAAGSAHLISGYMQHVLEEEESQSGGGGGGSGSGASTDPMANCKYLVMGEEKLVLKKTGQQPNSKVLTTPHCGYGVGRFPHDQDEQKHVHLLIDLNKVKSLVTVKQIWTKLEQTRAPLCCFSNRGRNFIDHLRFLCLSFSFFKLLRRRFEHYPMVEVGSKMARRLMLEGLLNNHEEPDRNAINAFRVLQLELDFLDNYYQAGVPVVISAPWLFFINFLMSLLFVSIYAFAVLVIVVTQLDSPDESLGRYIIIAMLLVITLLSIEITELLTVYLFSNWFLVHLLCLYTAPGSCLWNCLAKPIICSFIAFRFLVFNSFKLMLRLTGRQIKTTKIKIKQVSILQDCEPIKKLFAWASHVTLATEAKVAIVESLKGIDLGTGNVSLPHISGFNSRGKTATEIILACHLATELLDMAHGKRKKKKQQRQPEDRDRTVATTLSRFCMYLVARAPELLPDNETWVSDRYEEVKSCLKEASRRCYCGVWGRQSWKAVMETNKEHLKNPTAWAGAKLFQQVRTEDSAAAWKDLAEFWVKLLIYLAPSNDVEGHANALASSGGDLITCLWAFCTHAGIRRQHEDDGNQV